MKEQNLDALYLQWTDLNLNVKNVVFVNFGINDSLYNDYKGLKVKNKIVIAIKGEPKDMEGNFI